MGDVSFLRFVSVNNAHNLYWKQSKNFADGVSHHIKDSLFLTDPNVFGSVELPKGSRKAPKGSKTLKNKGIEAKSIKNLWKIY